MSTSRLGPGLSDPRQAQQHFATLIDRSHLATATVLVVGCDADGHPLTHVHVVDCDAQAAPSECAQVLDTVLGKLHVVPGSILCGLSLGLTRPGGDQVMDYDRTWFKAFFRVCSLRGLMPNGVYVVTRTGARAVQIDDAA